LRQLIEGAGPGKRRDRAARERCRRCSNAISKILDGIPHVANKTKKTRKRRNYSPNSS